MRDLRRLSASSGFALAWVCLAAGCTILGPQPERSRFFLLTPHAASSATEKASVDIAVGLGPVRFPDYLDRNQIATRVSESRVEYSAHDLWAEPLAAAFVRVLSQNLAGHLGVQKVVTHPWYNGTPLAYTVPVEVLRFDSDRGGAARLDVRWSVKSKGGEVLFGTESSFIDTAQGRNREDTVAALSRAVGGLGRAIAEEILRQETSRRANTSGRAMARSRP